MAGNPVIPSHIAYAFPCFQGKEMQVVYAIASLMIRGTCNSSMADIAKQAGVSKKACTSLVAKLRKLCVIATEGGKGKRLIIAFCNEKKTKAACEKAMKSIAVKRQKQTAPAREAQGEVEVLNNSGSLTGRGVEHPNTIIEEEIDNKIDNKIDINSNSNNKNREGRRGRIGGSAAHTRKEINAVKIVFEAYRQMEWSVQKDWKDDFLKKEGLCAKCEYLCSTNKTNEYLRWVDIKLDSIRENTKMAYKRYFATVLATTWFDEFFSTKNNESSRYNTTN